MLPGFSVFIDIDSGDANASFMKFNNLCDLYRLNCRLLRGLYSGLIYVAATSHQ